MTHILSNLPEEYQNTVKSIDKELDDNNKPLTIQRISDKLLVKFDQMEEQSMPRTSREYEKALYTKFQYKGTCMNGRK